MHIVSDQTHTINKITNEMRHILKVEYEIKDDILKENLPKSQPNICFLFCYVLSFDDISNKKYKN